jgi:cyclopropane fatty-acyl-phospholipid synthase-like methyltransferase
MNDTLSGPEDLDRALEALYGDIGMSDEEFEAHLNRSLNPRSSEMLYHKMAALDLGASHRLLDIGCRDAAHTCELVQRFGCQALGVDPIAHKIDLAHALIAKRGLEGQVRVVKGRIESIPAGDGEFDFIWCRDMLNHVPDLRAGLAECARALKRGGSMLVYQTFATELLEPREAARLYTPLAIVAANMSTVAFETACRDAGLRIAERDTIASEWRERWEEDGTRTTSQQLLWIARLRRDRERLIAELGRDAYECELADCHWGVYQMLGKLCPMMYVLRKT